MGNDPRRDPAPSATLAEMTERLDDALAEEDEGVREFGEMLEGLEQILGALLTLRGSGSVLASPRAEGLEAAVCDVTAMRDELERRQGNARRRRERLEQSVRRDENGQVVSVHVKPRGEFELH